MKQTTVIFFSSLYTQHMKNPYLTSSEQMKISQNSKNFYIALYIAHVKYPHFSDDQRIVTDP